MKKAFSKKHVFLIPLLLTFVLSGCGLGFLKSTMNLTPLQNLSSQWKVVSGSLVLKSVGDDQVADLVGIVTPNASGALNADTSPKAYTLQMDKSLSKPLSIEWRSMRAYFRYDVNLKIPLGQMFFVNLETEEVIHLFVKQDKPDTKKETLLTEIGWPTNRKGKLITYEGYGLAEHEGKMVTNATTLSKTETELFKQFAPCITWVAGKAQREEYCGSSTSDQYGVTCEAGGDDATSCSYSTNQGQGGSCTINCANGKDACCGVKLGSVRCKCCHVKDTGQ